MKIETYNQLHDRLRIMVAEKFGDRAYLQEVFIYKDEAIIELEGEKLVRVAYAYNERGHFQVKGHPVEVRREVVYTPARALERE